jgi:hypothetical protein
VVRYRLDRLFTRQVRAAGPRVTEAR